MGVVVVVVVVVMMVVVVVVVAVVASFVIYVIILSVVVPHHLLFLSVIFVWKQFGIEDLYPSLKSSNCFGPTKKRGFIDGGKQFSMDFLDFFPGRPGGHWHLMDGIS